MITVVERRFAGMRLSLGRDNRHRGRGRGPQRRQQPPVYVITDATPPQSWLRRGLTEGFGPGRGGGRGAWRQATARQVHAVPAAEWDDQHEQATESRPGAQKTRPTPPPVESTWHRNRKQAWPWLAAAVTGAAPVLWWLPLYVATYFGVGHWTLTVVVAATTALVAGRAAHVYASRAEPRWRRRIAAAAVFATAWVTATVWTGLIPVMYAALILATVALGGRWWAAHRTANPTQPPTRATTPADGDIAAHAKPDQHVARFAKYAAKKGGPADGCRLTAADIDDTRSIYTMIIRPGEDDLASIQTRRPKIATALGVHPEDVIIERHPTSRESTHLRLTIITRSPVEQPVVFTEPRWVEDDHGNAWIALGMYADGEGEVLLPVIQDHTSAENMLIVANRGGGKSTLLLLASITARSSGHAMLVYLDGKGGASSPILMAWADWAPPAKTEPQILANGHEVLRVLEAVLASRREQAMVEGVSGLAPSPGRPLIVLIIDECHKFLNDQSKLADDPKKTVSERWRDLLREMRAFAMTAWAATQGTKIDSFGGMTGAEIREYLGGNSTIVGRLRNPGAASTLGLGSFDPALLPQGGGHFYIDVKEGRSAPWRAWQVKDVRSAPKALDSQADEAFAALPARSLEAAALPHVPRAYAMRQHIAADRLAAMADGRPLPWFGTTGAAPAARPDQLELVPLGGWTPDWEAYKQRARTQQLAAVPAGLDGTHARVWREVAAGHDTVAALCTALELGKSRVHEVLTDLINAGHLHRADGRGQYAALHHE